MPHAANHRRRGSRHRPHHGLVVERPEVFQRTTAARHDDDVGAHALVECPQGGHDSRGGFLPLHQRRGKHHLGQGVTAAQGLENIAQSRAGGRSDHANHPRERRQGALAGVVEQPFGFQFGFQALEFAMQVARARGVEAVDIKLVAPPGGVNVDVAVGFHRVAIAGQKAPPLAQHLRLPHHTGQLGVAVFEGEIGMPRRGNFEVGNLALHPQFAQVVVAGDQVADIAGQVTDRPHNGAEELFKQHGTMITENRLRGAGG